MSAQQKSRHSLLHVVLGDETSLRHTAGRHKARETQPGTTEVVEVEAEKLRGELSAIRKAGGQVTQSGPGGRGYILHVFWRD